MTGYAKITINKKTVSKLTIRGVSNIKLYIRKQIKLTITIKNGNKKLTKGTDYTVTYGTNKETRKRGI